MCAKIAEPLVRVFSGIQPSGIPHLGNYFGTLTQWVNLAKGRNLQGFSASTITDVGHNSIYEGKSPDDLKCDTPFFCIVDVHAYTSPSVKYGTQLYKNILDTTASLLAIGLNSDNCILFRQSDILEHNFLDNVLQNFITTQRLSRMTQYKEKAPRAAAKGVTNGLLTYPVLQAADILLYGADFVPIGEDQIQHLELTRELARNFNRATSTDLLKEPGTLLNQFEHGRRIKSLRDPLKKMSKSDQDKKAFIEIVDEPEILREKLKKAMTDNISEVYYDPANRPGISNLMRLHHLATGESFSDIRAHAANISSAQYKIVLADILIEKLKPVRNEFKSIQNDRDYLESVLKLGYDRAKPIASEMISRVRNVLGSTSTCEN